MKKSVKALLLVCALSVMFALVGTGQELVRIGCSWPTYIEWDQTSPAPRL